MQIKCIRGRYFALLRRPDGGTHKIPLLTKDETEAYRIASDGKLQEMEYAALAGGAALTAAVKMAGVTSCPVAEAIDEYIEELRRAGRAPNTLTQYEKYLTTWMIRMGRERTLVNNVKPEEIDVFVNTSENISFVTRGYRLTVLRLFFEKQIEKCRVLHNPCNGIGVRRHELSQKQMMRKRTHAFTNEEWERLYEAAKFEDPFWRFLLIYGRDSALRLTDVALMELVNIEGDTVRVAMRKTGREVTLPMTPLMRSVLSSLPRQDFGVHLFPENALQLRLGNSSNIRRDFRRLMNSAGVTLGSIRSLRKMGAMQAKANASTTLTNLIEEHSTRAAQVQLGHTTPNTTKKFYLNE